MQASTVDIERIAIWREQRDRLRQRLLGDRVVQAWWAVTGYAVRRAR